MNPIKAFLSLLYLALLSQSQLNAEEKNAEEKTIGVEVELLAEVNAIVPGKSFQIGLRIRHEKGFHTYWQNPGIVGFATQLNWQLPEGFEAGPIQWPYPEQVDMSGHPAHGFHRDILLLTTITPPAQLAAKNITLRAQAVWMACENTCHPGKQQLALSLPVGEQIELNPEHLPHFKKAHADLPAVLAPWTARVMSEPTAETILLELTPPQEPSPLPVKSLYFFSSDKQVSSDQKQTFTQQEDGSLLLTMQRSPLGPKQPTELTGVISGLGTPQKITAQYPEAQSPQP